MIRETRDTISMEDLKRPLMGFVVFLMLLGVFKKVGGFLLFSSTSEQPASYSYEMVRPPEEKRRKSLADYEVVERSHHWKMPEERIPMSDKSVKNTANGKAQTKKVDTAAQLKKAKEAAAKAAALRKQLEAKRRAQMQVQVLEDDSATASNESVFPEVVYYSGDSRVRAFRPSGERSPEDADAAKKSRTSAREWRTLLNTSPSRENMDKLLSAKRARKLNNADFYLIVKELLLSHADDRQRAAVYVLQRDVSAESFEFIVSQRSQAVPQVQEQLKSLVTKYSEPAQLDELSRVVVSSKNPVVVMEAMRGVMVSVQAWREQKENSSQGGARNPAYTARFEQELKSLIPSLRRVSTRSSEMASLAEEIMNQIESDSRNS